MLQRRRTNQSVANMTGQASKEETFEASSFFDEGPSGNRALAGASSPHKCNLVEGYNMPTIFNTLMFGIDQSKVSENVKESFTTIQGVS
jgi:hypothetical protein